jgi:DNA-directed RNA polymerase specialized sigma24 family protein
MDTDGFEDWYRREHPKLVNSLFAASGSVDAAREATDEAFARAAARWPRVRSMDHPTAWTYRVALNALRKSSRRQSREMVPAVRNASSRTVPAPAAHPEVWASIRALPPQQRNAIVLRYERQWVRGDRALRTGAVVHSRVRPPRPLRRSPPRCLGDRARFVRERRVDRGHDQEL